MKGTEKIIAHIQADADAQAAEILARADARCAEIRETYEQKAKEAYAETIRAGVKENQDRLDSMERLANMEGRKAILALKQDMVARSFDRAVEMLVALPEAEYVALLSKLAVGASVSPGYGQLPGRSHPAPREHRGQLHGGAVGRSLPRGHGRRACRRTLRLTIPIKGGKTLSTKKEAYLCLSAMLRAREPKLLNNERAERMLDAASFEDAAKILTDCGYPDMSQMTASEVEQALAEHRSEIFEELGRLSPDRELVDVFKLKYDYHNAKAIIKAEAMGSDAKRLLSDAGRVSGAELLELYHAEHYSQLPPTFGKAVAEARSVLARTANPQLSDFVLDKAYFREMNALAEALDSDFARGYVALLADSTNLRSAVRILRMGKDIGYLREALVSGGSVSEERLIQGISGEGLASVFAGSALSKAAQLGADAVSGGTLTAFELACDNAVAGYLADAKLCSFGEESVIAYLAGTENELTAVRMILTGRLSGVPSDTIRERLRDLYA